MRMEKEKIRFVGGDLSLCRKQKKKLRFIHLFLLVCTFVTASCMQNQENQGEEKKIEIDDGSYQSFPPPKGVKDPSVKYAIKIPQFELTKSLVGLDNNNDGIRDDIERFIDDLEITPLQRDSLRKVAGSLQKTLLVDLDNEEEINKVVKTQLYALSCAMERFTGDAAAIGREYISILQAANANTVERTERYIKYNVALSGRVFSMPSGDVCDENF